jgi:hypothetical protein
LLNGKRDSNFFAAKKTTVQSVIFSINSWLKRMVLSKTFEECEKVEDLDGSIQDMRQLLSEGNDKKE